MTKRIDDSHEQKPADGQSPWSPKKHKDPHPKDMQCQKQSGLLRCALPARWFPNNGTRGYCWLHDDGRVIIDSASNDCNVVIEEATSLE